MKPSFAFSALAFAATLLATTPALAQVSVKDPWVRGTVPQQKATGAFMQLTSTQDARLVSASSPVAGVVEIHEMKMQDGVMRMRPIAALELPANQHVELKPGGYHVMLMDLKKPLAAGESVPLTLTFETRDGKTSSLDLQAPVRALTASSGGAMHGHK